MIHQHGINVAFSLNGPDLNVHVRFNGTEWRGHADYADLCSAADLGLTRSADKYEARASELFEWMQDNSHDMPPLDMGVEGYLIVAFADLLRALDLDLTDGGSSTRPTRGRRRQVK